MVSLVLLNSHFSLGFPRPYFPNMIEVGGMQINQNPAPLPKEIKDFIESAQDGVAFFSMGYKNYLLNIVMHCFFLNFDIFDIGLIFGHPE